MRALMLLTAALSLASPAAAQVYKCKGTNGETVYQQDPCGADAKPMTVRGTKAATPTQGENKSREQVFRSTDLSDAAIAERNCVTSAHDAIYRPSNARVASYRSQIAALNQELALTNNNLAGATLASGLHSRISGLQNSIATEQASADQQASAATQRCAEARKAREAAIERRYTPAQPPEG